MQGGAHSWLSWFITPITSVYGIRLEIYIYICDSLPFVGLRNQRMSLRVKILTTKPVVKMSYLSVVKLGNANDC